ncbi:hypothetical protein C5746_42995 [Streptomyces atratus]|uniref:Uncharacterized protein n=1 Tax=Streptomyces atratus TaxID=1893 RepID=A0A2Z5JQE1_STRAR|nr:hypothetical protein C5746_00240 [Streptomyces atratus]AXE82479.1 hypothetical protein C5746_42995 [Streptomyces atratus]
MLFRDHVGTWPGGLTVVLALHGSGTGTGAFFHAVRGRTCRRRPDRHDGGGILGLDGQAPAGFHPRTDHVLVTAAGPDEGSQKFLSG